MLHGQQEAPAIAFGVEIVEQRGADIADMERAGGTGREADGDGFTGHFLVDASINIAESIGDGIAAVATKIARGNLDAGGRLSTLVFGYIEEVIDTLDDMAVIAVWHDIAGRKLLFDNTI